MALRSLRLNRKARQITLIGGLLVLWASAWSPPVRATWSIILVDTETKEIVVGSATCLTGFDLKQWLPVVVVDTGAGVAQSFVDSNGQNRALIFVALELGIAPETILELLENQDPNHQTRQYGIADTFGRKATFTGSIAGAWADGVVGQSGTMHYAIQGNVLTGPPVVEMAEQAVLSTVGSLPEKLMAGMEAARSMGGDGRCSCLPNDPTGCGSPPKRGFVKSAHVGFMIGSRTGDIDGTCNVSVGCASGDYFMVLNVPFQTANDLDPVLQLQDMFDKFQASLIGRPDAILSTATIDPPTLPAEKAGTATMTIQFVDRLGTPIDPGTISVSVEHLDEVSDQAMMIGPVVDVGGGAYEVQLVGTGAVGNDVYVVTANDGVRPVVVMPVPKFVASAPADFDTDGDVDENDWALFAGCMTGPGNPVDGACSATDIDGDTDADFRDFAKFMVQFTDEPCVRLILTQQPEPEDLLCGSEYTLSVGVDADPAANFQWFIDGVPIPGATESEYHIESADNPDHGDYFVRMANTCEVLQSFTVLVRVFPDPCPGP